MMNLFIGPMFSGKSTYQLGQADPYLKAKTDVYFVRPTMDTRNFLARNMNNDYYFNNDNFIITPEKDLGDLLATGTGLVVFVDEVQFISGDTLEALLKHHHKHEVCLAGLNSKAKKAGSWPEVWPNITALIPHSTITTLKARCVECGSDALYSVFEADLAGDVHIGDEGYSAKCLDCISKAEQAS